MADNEIFIGKKPIMSYVTACITALNYPKNKGEVSIAARGQSINRLVDVIEVLKRFINYEIKNVEFGTDIIKQEGDERRISSLRVTIGKLR